MSTNWKRDEHFQFFIGHNDTLTMRQISDQHEAARYSQLTIGGTTISITSDILDFLGYEGQAFTKQQKFRELLNRAEIPFKRIAYDDSNADDAVKEDGLKLTEHNRQQKRWITMNVDDFKDALMMLNTKRAKEIRLYYRNLESAVFQFIHHSLSTKDAAIDAERHKVQELTQRVTEIEFASEAEKAAHVEELATRTEEVDDLIQNRHVPRRTGFDNVLCFVDKNEPEDEGLSALYPYWVYGK